MEKVPKKNISLKMRDIKVGGEELTPKDVKALKQAGVADAKVLVSIYKGAPSPENDPGTTNTPLPAQGAAELPLRGAAGRGIKKFIFAFAGIAMVAVLGLFAFRVYVLKERVSASVASGAMYLERGLSDLRNFDTDSATENFTALHELANVSDPGMLFTNIFSLLKDGAATMKSFQTLTGGALALVEQFAFLEDHWLAMFAGGDGKAVLGSLGKVADILGEIRKENQAFVAASGRIKKIAPVNFSGALPLDLDLGRFEDFLRAFTAWLKDPAPHHVALFLENPSEVRPGGGFIGSYADALFTDAGISSLEVRDINDPDRELNEKIVPPKPLQLIATGWHAADANWFFDFPSSAAQVISMFEASEFYRKSGVTFDGAIGVSARVVTDILELTGPLELSAYKLTLNAENVFTEIQKKVMLSREQKLQQPKEILKELMARVQERVAAFDKEKRKMLIEYVGRWLERKDLVFYFKKPELQNFFAYYGFIGAVASTPSDFNGEYLAVVNANIGGQKTDLFMDQRVVFQSQLGEDGTVDNHLTITRTHNGKQGGYWWYTAPNQEYVQVFTPVGVQLANANGMVQKKITPKADYKKQGYAANQLVEEIEATEGDFLSFPAVKSYEQFGKNVFAFWSRTAVGATSTVSIDYSRRLFALPTEDRPYRFILEKQRGVESEYAIQINAPVGYRWRENHLPVYEYISGDPPGRFEVTLTLEKL